MLQVISSGGGGGSEEHYWEDKEYPCSLFQNCGTYVIVMQYMVI